MKKANENYIYVPTNMPLKDNKLKVVYHRKYLDKMPKSLIYKIKKALYEYIMQYMRSKPINDVAILNRAQAVIIDKKYAKLYTLIADKYDSFEEHYERQANDVRYMLLYKLIKTGKLSMGLALSLFIVLTDQKLVSKVEEHENKYEPIEYTYEVAGNTIDLLEKPEEFNEDIKLTEVLSSNSYQTENLVYTVESCPHHLLNPENQALFEHYIHEYAFYFNLNPELLIDVFKQATEDYTNIDLVLNAERFDLTNPETIAIMYTYYFYRNPEKYLNINLADYGYTSKSDFVTSDEIYIIEPNWMHDHIEDSTVAKEDITLRNNLTYSEYLGRMSDLIGIPEEYKPYVLSVSYAERGLYGSPISIYKNNMGGQRADDGSYITYPSPEAGIIAFIVNLRRYEWDYNITDMAKFGSTYDGDAFVDQWISNVNDNKFMIANNSADYFLTEQEEYQYAMNIQNLLENNNTQYEVLTASNKPIKYLIYAKKDTNIKE